MDTTTAQQSWNDRYAASEYVWSLKPNEFVEQHLQALQPGPAIDLGAGEGRNAVWLASLGWQVMAVDFSRKGLDKAERLAADNGVNIVTVEADATTYQPEEPVDLVVLSYLQLAPEHRRTALEHAKTWLTPGATLLVIAHDRSNVDGGYGGPPSPAVCYDVDETVAALAGLEIMTAEVVERVVQSDSGPQIALDTLVIAKRPPDSPPA